MCNHCNTEEAFMKQAIDLSVEKMNSGFGGPFGALIVKDGEIVSEGFNQVTSANDPTAHAEMTAIREACKKLNTFDLSGCVIYTSCEPCPMCLSAIYWARLDKIYFANTRQDAAEIGFDDEFLYLEIPKDLDDRDIPCVQMSRAEGLKAFQLWRDKPDKIHY